MTANNEVRNALCKKLRLKCILRPMVVAIENEHTAINVGVGLNILFHEELIAIIEVINSNETKMA